MARKTTLTRTENATVPLKLVFMNSKWWVKYWILNFLLSHHLSISDINIFMILSYSVSLIFMILSYSVSLTHCVYTGLIKKLPDHRLFAFCTEIFNVRRDFTFLFYYAKRLIQWRRYVTVNELKVNMSIALYTQRLSFASSNDTRIR